MNDLLTLLIFGATWTFIAFPHLRWLPLGRTAGALAGAVLVVACGLLRPEEAYAALDHDTLTLLLGMMLLTSDLERGGLFDAIVRAAFRFARTGTSLLIHVTWLSGAAAAFLVNDAVCLFWTPVIVQLCRRAELPLAPFLLALATSANIGSAATLVGNPQNMIIGHLSEIAFGDFLFRAGPIAALGVAVNLALLLAYYGRALHRPLPAQPTTENVPLDHTTLFVMVCLVSAFFLGAHLGFATLTAAVGLMVAKRRRPEDAFTRVDGSLLLFFASLFVVMAAVGRAGWVEAMGAQRFAQFDASAPGTTAAFTAFVLLASNLVSNVPLVLLVGPELPLDATRAWVLLAYVSTVAGNLTLVGSVANLIVAERARDHHHLSFMEYLRFGVPSTLLVLAVTLPFAWWWLPG